MFNKVKQVIDWLTGTERRAKADFKVYSRKPDGDWEAEIKTGLIKYIYDINRIEYAISDAFKDAVKVGIGWLEVGIRSDPEEEPIYVRHESWKNILKL